MNVLQLLLLLLAGTGAGFLNALAGGGSLLTLPILILSGLPPAVANGTNRIALMAQNIVAVKNFKNKGYYHPKLGLWLGIPAILGSLLGARLAISLPPSLFNRILAITMFIMLLLILWNPVQKYKKPPEKFSSRRLALAVISFFFIGIYGGFIQIGVGIIIITVLTLLTGFPLVKINSIKVMVVLIYMFFSLLVFILSGNVNWLLGLILAAANSFGAWLGTSFAVEKGEGLVKLVLVIAVLLMAGNLLLKV